MRAGYISRRSILQAGLLGLGLGIEQFKQIAHADAAGDIVIAWNNATLQAIRVVRPGVTVVARALAIVHTCIYDAWAAYDDFAVGTSSQGIVQRRPSSEQTLVNKQEAISYAAYRALIDLFPTQTAYFFGIMTSLGYNPHDQAINFVTPVGIGNLVALLVLAFRHYDGSNQLGDLHPGPYSDYTGYQPINTPDSINNPNRWQPLRLSDGQGGSVVQHCVTPQWDHVRPFALTSGSQFRLAIGPATYPFINYRVQAQEVLNYSALLNDTDKVIAEYWKDGPASEQPPGHWCLFAQLVSQRNDYSLDRNVQLFFILTNALLDCSIACWDTKLAYDSERPITAIHYLFKGQKVLAWAGPYRGTQLIDGSTWQPYQPDTFITPAFPEFCSGHSTFSAASAEILSRFTGSHQLDASFTKAAGSSAIEPGTVPATDVTLTWTTFEDAAQQAGISRRYGGIHFQQGDLAGRSLGLEVAQQVWRQAQLYLNGKI